jgi:hypothetical protein
MLNNLLAHQLICSSGKHTVTTVNMTAFKLFTPEHTGRIAKSAPTRRSEGREDEPFKKIQSVLREIIDIAGIYLRCLQLE